MNILVFTIGDKEYGAAITQVREVIRLGQILSIPDAPDFVEGLINRRGRVIPLINARKKFGLPAQELNRSNRIVITQVDSHVIGVIVDKVSSVIALGKEQIQPPDEILKEARYLTGVGKFLNRLILIIDIERFLSNEDKANIKNVNDRIEIKKRP